MNSEELKKILTQVQEKKLEVDDALRKLEDFPYADLGFAKIDHHREIRTGYPEIIFCEGKTIDQVVKISEHMYEKGGNIIATHANREMFDELVKTIPSAKYYNVARIISVQQRKVKTVKTYIAIVTAGTADIPVAEEAAVTAELLGNKVERIFDAGVAGLHRLVDNISVLRQARVVIVIAGMEGALASIVGGLINKPIVAVPTSVGYGANFQGVSALLAMLTSCANGVSVVNIDNGFGAGFNASMINKL